MTDLIARTFADTFAHWKLTLPKRNLERRTPGVIARLGWLIQYRFGEDDRGRYLDYYAAHRMTDDNHVRIREDGSCEGLPSIRSFYSYAKPRDKKAARLKNTAENRTVAQMLADKGFDRFTLNMALAAGFVETEKP